MYKTLPKCTKMESDLIPEIPPELRDSSGIVDPKLHRRRTLYLIRHGEAVHNVLEAKAQEKAKQEGQKKNLPPDEIQQKMEEARRSVLHDGSLRDAALTDKGRQQAREASKKLHQLIHTGIHPPTEAMCSPLSRCLETCQILLKDADLDAKIQYEVAERQTQLPPDKPKSYRKLMHYVRASSHKFLINHVDQLSPQQINDETQVRESKEMLRERANGFFDLLLEMEHRHVLVVSHKGFLRELERGLLQMPNSPLFGNCELRVYRVIFTRGDRKLAHIERLDS